jgi:hypothetical protein
MHWTQRPDADEIRKRISVNRTGKGLGPRTEQEKEAIRVATLGKNKGKKRTPEHRRTISVKLTGRKLSNETRLKISKAAQNRDLSKTLHSPVSRAKAAESNKGKIPWNTGQPMLPQTREALSLSVKGVSKSREHRFKMSISRQGENTPHWWKGGIAEQNQREHQREMHRFRYKNWREQVFERDHYRCVLEDETCSGHLHADHVKSFRNFPDLRFDVNNGQTLCKHHHEQTPNYGGRVFIQELVAATPILTTTAE